MTCILSVVFFYDGCHFSDFGSFLEGRLPPGDGSDRAENLTRSVSDEIAKKHIPSPKEKSGCHFSDLPNISDFEGTWVGRTREPASPVNGYPGRQQKNQIAS